MKTLFVTGIQSFHDIMEFYKEKNANISSLVLITVTSQLTQMSLKTGILMIRAFTDQGILCSLDIPSTINLEWFLDGGLTEYDNFIPQLRVVSSLH